MSFSGYVLDSGNECDRLERQAALDGLERYLRHLPSQSQARVLDAGCGSGAMCRLIASRHPGFEVTGLDLNSAYVAYARDRSRADGLGNLRFEQGDLQALPLPAASFDAVWSRFVLYFLPRPEAALAEFKRVIRPTGSVVIFLHNWSTLINYPEDAHLRDRQQRVFAGIADMRLAQKMPSMLTAAGFHDVSVEIELDPVYTAIGSIKEANRRNFTEVFEAGIDRVSEALGSRAAADLFVADSLAYYDRPDTYTYSLLWTIKCRAPAC
jgi:ubiquinone/menaquinone biosynthesis C-methylase UbiE